MLQYYFYFMQVPYYKMELFHTKYYDYIRGLILQLSRSFPIELHSDITFSTHFLLAATFVVLLIAFANSIDPDQVQQNINTDLGLN